MARESVGIACSDLPSVRYYHGETSGQALPAYFCKDRHSLDKAFRIYAWFLLVVTALPAAARLAKPRELARILLVRYQHPQRRKRARIGGLIYLGLSLFAIPFLLRPEMRRERWLVMAVLVGMVSALEFLLNSRGLSEDILTRQNRAFGGVYASMAIAVALLLFTR